MRKFLVGLMIVVAVTVVGLLLTRGPAHETGVTVEPATQGPRLAVEVVEVTRGDLRETVAINVTFAPESTVPVIPKTGGTVTQVLAATGDRVRKGQTLFLIDDTPLQLQVKQAEAAYEMACANLAQAQKGASAEELKQIESAVAQARASYNNVAAEYARMAELYQREMISRQQLDAIALQKEIAASNLTAAEARLTAVQKGATKEQLDMLEAQVKQAKSALELARLQLSYTRVTAPITGVLAQFAVEEGSMVAPSAPAGVIIDDRKMKAHALVPESYVNAVKPGDPILLEAKAVPGTSFTGTVTAVAPLADQTTRQFPVEIAVANPSNLLKAGMTGTAYLTINENRNQLLIPVGTVLYDGEQTYVYVVEGGYAVRRNITTGLTTGESVVVTAGLDEGMRVISRGQHQVKNGMAVEVR
ncbi:efflux RND transporter periplasmic adaptor subunit [Capillibacterium thermochitinicola]|uniref:Efflux RND transporter periplasmic adaptor subunit n=1 Tax=Capillibacterium thermochitinicola TaxID=2699427 RepID=A0A8J6LLD6_9FIRM|nr:efflux RND transporter periplasmic adaptor subunit [Capillibacterium thermochitinicola]MBA2132003.1 efflux RND transporter periplasmic adaptor subunit [Capillibacterium thermochitinicola]